MTGQGQPVEFRGREDARRAAAHGRDKEPEHDDPYEIVGVRFALPEGVDGDREMARCFVEEFALMGWSPDRIRSLFANPQYAGAHDLVRRRGQGIVDEAIATVFGAVSEPGDLRAEAI